jgi:glycosyltransferase involved in cell wall biosynthesis
VKILLVVTYYSPHISGLTLYVRRLAEGLASEGNEVTVLASQHDPLLPLTEIVNGVRIVRVPVAVKISKGGLMPRFPLEMWKLAREHDVVNIHLPQFEAGIAALLSKVAGRPVFLTYHCDLELPPGRVNGVIDAVVFSMNYVAAVFADKIVAYTRDYATHSRLLRRFLRKVVVIPPPVISPEVHAPARDSIRRELGLEGKCVMGSATRVATEKGIEYLLQSIPYIAEKRPDIHLLHIGENKAVIGEEEYLRRLQPLVDRFREEAVFLGQVPADRAPVFFSSIDVLVVSSVNSTESFGLVQVEAMLQGTPVVATDLPGVRQPVLMTGMGKVVPLRDPQAIADAVVDILDNRDAYIRPRAEIEKMFDLKATLTRYLELFRWN